RVDPNEAQRRVAIQDRAAGIEDDIAKVLGDQYSGLWYDHTDGGKLKIGMTRAAMKRAGEVRRIAKSYGVLADTDFVRVRFTQAELEQKQDLIRKMIKDMVDAGQSRTSYDTKANKVVVTALAKLPPREDARLKTLTKIAGVTVRRTNKSTLRGKLNSCNVTYCNRPFRGGREIGKHGIPQCTAAFMARDRTNPNDLWALTAGHCIFFAGTNWLSRDETTPVDQSWRLIGNTAFYDFSGAPGRDVGKIWVDPKGFWDTPAPCPAVVVKSSSIHCDVHTGCTAAATTYNPKYWIGNTSLSSIGQVLCRTGRTTGTECGEVSALNTDETALGPDGLVYMFHHMGNISVCGAAPGDSGGPLYKNHRAYGIFSQVHLPELLP